MKSKRLLALTLTLCMLFSLLPFGGSVAYAAEDETVTVSSQPMEIEELDGSDIDVDLTKDGEDVADAGLDQEIIDPAEEVRVIIVMEGDSIIEEDSSAVLDSETEARIEALEENQAAVVSEIEETVLEGEPLEVTYSYTWLLNGVAATVPYGAIEEIEALAGVRQVLRQRVYTPCETETSDIAYPMTVSDGVMIGRESAWASGYTGEGIKIAIIDTGLDTDHQNFQALDEDVQISATKETVGAVLGSLNADSRYNGTLTVDKVYLSSKIAYAFDYGENDTSVDHDAAGDHGTHVAGIAAANKVDDSDVVGVAPDAQLYIMKVSDANGVMYDDYILAALEDALILGADVVNMSLGSPAGFTTDGAPYDEIYSRASGTGTVLAISAGNSYTMGYGNAWGTNENLTSNPDNAVISSPGTYTNVLSVASIENAYYNSEYLTAGDHHIGYTDGSYGNNAPFSDLAGEGEELQIVAVPGTGKDSDYEGLDVKGKIALVQRGEISFGDKSVYAQAAGAVACLVYNNASGSLNMDLTGCTATIPCASISMADGAYLIALLEEDPNLAVTIGEGETLVASPTGNQMSDFSSWGVAPDLSLEPDITAPGGNIYSTLDGGTYGLMSGTSMASPNVAGMSALVSQYVRENYDLSGEALQAFVKLLLMSTSVPVTYDGNLYYSPRSQGSGLANVYNAVATQAYLSVDGCDTPKAELGDDPDRTGSYGFRFDVNNLGDSDLFYDLSAVAQTEDVDETYADFGYYFMSSTPRALSAAVGTDSASMVLVHDVDDSGETGSHDAYLIYQAAVAGNPADENWTDVSFRYNLDGNETVDADDVQAYLDALVGNDSPADLTAKVLRVAAGETAVVNVSVNLTDSDKEYFDTYYENGGYVEGFTFLTARNAGGVDLSLPYLAFYGGWDEAPVIDSGFYWEDEDELAYNQYINILWTQFGSSSWLPGLNAYLDEEFDQSHISLSPNGDGYADYIDDIYVSLLRNAAKISFSYIGEDETVYSEEVSAHESKSYYADSYGLCVPFVYSWVSKGYDLTDENGEVLPNNTRLTLSIAATIDYEGAEADVWETPIIVDTEAPELLDAELLMNPTNGAYYVELTFRDNVSVAAVNFVNSRGTVVYGQYLAPDEEAEIDEDGYLVWTARYDVTGLGDHFTVALGDYALNESYYSVKAPGNDIELDGELLYGYRIADSEIYDDSLYGWLGMEIVEDEDGATSVATETLSSEYYVDYALTAAEQVGGYIIACDANNDLVWIRPGYWDERSVITHLDVQLRDMTYDPITEKLYGLTTGTARLVTIDINTGELKYVGTSYLSSAVALACDDNGSLYGIYSMGMSAQFRTINKETGAWGETLATNANGMPGAYYSQSMTYKEGVFYWAQYGFSYSGYGSLYTIAQDEAGTWTAAKIGTIAGSAEVVGLLWLDTNEFAWPEEAELESLTVTPEAKSILVGGSTTLTALQTPWYCGAEIQWSSSDETVATVNADGVVTGVGVGSATITAFSGDISASATVSVVDPQTELTGFIFSSLDSNYSLYNQWASFLANTPEDYELLTGSGEVNFTAAEYLDGVIYAYDETSNFYTVDPTDFSYRKINSMVSDRQIIDMAYDYTTGNMYGLLVDYNYGETYLVTIDLQTGKFQTVGTLSDGKYSMAVGIAVDNNGLVYYVCGTYGFLCTYDPATDETTVVGLTGFVPYSYIQSMTYDHDTEELYWAAFTSGSFGLMYLDQATGQALELGTVAKEYGGAEIIGLHTVPANPPETPYVEVEAVYLTEDSITLVEGGSAVAPVEVLPYNATDREITWNVADESIASVDGVTVTGLKTGTTTATGTVGEFTVELEINVVESVGAFRAYVLGDFVEGSTGYWIEMYDSDIHTPGQSDFLFWSDTDVYAATYYDGYLWTYSEDSNDYNNDTSMHFRQIDAETGEIVADYTGYDYYLSIMDLTFDYSEGAMYAVGNTKNSEDNSTLYAFDLSDGQLYAVAPTSEYLVALACSEDGQLYAVNTSGVLFSLDKVTGELTEVGETGYPAHGYQSMAFDYDSGKLYWAQTNYVNSWFGDGAQDAAFLLVDTEDGSTLNLGVTNAMLSGLYFPTEEEPQVPETVEVSSISLSATSLLLGEGDSETLTAMLLPISVRDVAGEITFTSSDETVAVVDDNGVVTAVSAGAAVITAACGDISATCTVNVVDDDTLLYAVNAGGWEATPLLNPGNSGEQAESAKLAEELGLIIVSAAYNTDDGYVYAVDEEGYLWKLTLDLGTVEQIGNVLGNIVDVDYTPKIIDIAYNPYAGGLYALVGDYYYNEYWDYGYFNDFYVYEVSTEDASSTQVAALSSDIGNAVGFAFNSADTFLVYDTTMDYVWEAELSTWYGDARRVLWAQQALAANEENFAMTYSKELNRLFIVTTDWYYGSGNQALYMFNPDNGSFGVVADGAWTEAVVSLLLIEGADPVITETQGEELTEPVTEDAVEGSAEETEVPEESAEPVTEEAVEGSAEKTEVPEESAEPVTEEPVEGSAEETEVPEESAEPVTEESVDGSTEETEVPEESAGLITEETNED